MLKRKSLQGGSAETIANLPPGTAAVHGIHWSRTTPSSSAPDR